MVLVVFNLGDGLLPFVLCLGAFLLLLSGFFRQFWRSFSDLPQPQLRALCSHGCTVPLCDASRQRSQRRAARPLPTSLLWVLL